MRMVYLNLQAGFTLSQVGRQSAKRIAPSNRCQWRNALRVLVGFAILRDDYNAIIVNIYKNCFVLV